MKKTVFLLLLMLLPTVLSAQAEVLLFQGRVMCEGKGVAYASLHLAGTSIGVTSNDAGEYELKVPAERIDDTVVIRSLGYKEVRCAVRDLMKGNAVVLRAQPIELQEIKVKDFRSGRQLVKVAVGRIKKNYHTAATYPTFFYRDWWTLDGELYLLDEAVMRMQRAGYGTFSDKQGYVYTVSQREMETDYKELLKHRLVVYDRRMLEKALIKRRGVDEMVEYDDNTVFFDPVATPQASYMLASRMLGKHEFEPVKVFEDNGEKYYYVRSRGMGRVAKSTVHYEYVIRKKDLAIVRITSSQDTVMQWVPQDAWVNVYYNRLTIDKDTSAWVYEVREGRYTLTHYYNNKVFHLGSKGRGHDKDGQWWQMCEDWTLTDFSVQAPVHEGKEIEARPQTLAGAFGEGESITSSYWEQYNSIVIDTLPLRLLVEKLKKRKR